MFERHVKGTLEERVQLMEVDTPEVLHVHFDGKPEHVKQFKNTQFEVGSRQAAHFDGLYFVGPVCHGELNDPVLSNYIQVVSSLS